MTPAEVIRLLAIVATFDNRRVEDTTIAAWSSVFEGQPWTFDQCREAVIRHVRTSTDYLLPAHIIRLARVVRDEEERAAMRLAVAAAANLRTESTPKPSNFEEIVERAREEARAARDRG